MYKLFNSMCAFRIGIRSKITILSILVIFSVPVHAICLGVFQDKVICEAEKRFKKDRQTCREYSWSKCEVFVKQQGVSAQYMRCIDTYRDACMVSLGYESEFN